MAVTYASRAGRQKLPSTNRTPLRGYARSRRAYDARRRAVVEMPSDRQALRDYAELVRGDVCSYCMGHCGQMAADHISPLEHGGENRWDNLTAAGRPCNAAKKAKKLILFLAERR